MSIPDWKIDYTKIKEANPRHTWQSMEQHFKVRRDSNGHNERILVLVKVKEQNRECSMVKTPRWKCKRPKRERASLVNRRQEPWSNTDQKAHPNETISLLHGLVQLRLSSLVEGQLWIDHRCSIDNYAAVLATVDSLIYAHHFFLLEKLTLNCLHLAPASIGEKCLINPRFWRETLFWIRNTNEYLPIPPVHVYRDDPNKP